MSRWCLLCSTAGVWSGFACAFDTTSSNRGTQSSPDAQEAGDAEIRSDAADASFVFDAAAPYDAQLGLPDAGACDCNDNVACTRDTCSFFGCSNVDICINGHTCNQSTGGCERSLVFVQGFAYSGAQDTYIHEADADSNFGLGEHFEWDNSDNGGAVWGLLRFDSMFADASNRIPANSTIESARLTMRVRDVGEPGALFECTTDWSDTTVTWNNLGDVPGPQPEDIGDFVAPITGDTLGPTTVDVTASMQRWSEDPDRNFGWIVAPNKDNGVEVHSSNASDIAVRPRLTVTYSIAP